MHFTPTSSSWLNLVERWFAELTTKKLRRGTHTSVRQLNTDIRAWIDTWNDNPRPYVWTKTADQILASIGNYPRAVGACSVRRLGPYSPWVASQPSIRSATACHPGSTIMLWPMLGKNSAFVW